MRMLPIIAICALLPCAVAFGSTTFTEKPTVARTTAGVTISFAVSAATDVEVAVVDGAGKVVRHLAAGMLGPNAPAPLVANSLKQSIVWDGKTIAGQDAPAGCKVRVSLGLAPTFDKAIGESPAGIGAVRGFAVAANGELFVLHHFGAIHPDDDTGFVTVFTRDGKYARTILPYPAGLSDAQLGGVRRITLPDGSVVPFYYNGELRSMVPGTGTFSIQQPAVTRDGQFVFIGHQEIVGTISRYNQSGRRPVVVINGDGSIPAGGPVRTVLAKSTHGSGSLAVAPDGKTFYAADLNDGMHKNAKRFHCVFKFTLDDAEPKVFVGNPDEPGAGPDKLNDPNSVTVDKDGNVYIADSGNGRIVAFKPDGTLLGQIAVENPDRLAVHPKTGAIYVTVGLNDRTLLKFDSLSAKVPSARLEKLGFFARGENRDKTVLAVDGSAEPAYVYYTTARSQWAGGFSLLRIADEGNAFGQPEDISKLAGGGDGIGSVLMLTLDRTRGRLYMDNHVYDTATGKLDVGLGKIIQDRGRIARIGTKHGHGSVGQDGLLYLMGYSNWMRRYDANLKLVPFADGVGKDGTFINTEDTGSLRLRARGVTADPKGNIYALWQSSAKNAANYLTLHNPDGTIKDKKLIDSQMRGLNSPRLDAQGNIYVTLSARPREQLLPHDFPKIDLPGGWKYGINSHEMNWYEMFYGCIVKFGPEGGKIVDVTPRKDVTPPAEPADAMKMEYGLPSRKTLVSLQGAKWVYFGASPAASWRQPYPDTCDCESTQFDVDSYGRSFFPDAVRSRISVLDANGNYLGSFGEYGNVDAKGSGRRIPFYWPYQVALDDNRTVYVGDRLNCRVMAVKLDYAVEETVALP